MAILDDMALIQNASRPDRRSRLLSETGLAIAGTFVHGHPYLACYLSLLGSRLSSRRATVGSRQPLGFDGNEGDELTVECYSGRKADERPVRFFLDGREYRVEAVLDQWYDPESISYRVRGDDGNLYIIRHRTTILEGECELVSFRRTS